MDLAERTFKRFQHALKSLEEAVSMDGIPPEIKRDVVQLRFQLVAEIMPKMLKRVLQKRGADVVLPKDIVRQANSGGIITEEIAKVMLAVIDDRNRMVHDYNESFAKALYSRIGGSYLSSFQLVEKNLKF